MGIVEFLQSVGEHRVMLQFLDADTTDLRVSGGKTLLTFGSPVVVDPVTLETDLLGIVVWIDRSDAKGVKAEAAARKGALS